MQERAGGPPAPAERKSSRDKVAARDDVRQRGMGREGPPARREGEPGLVGSTGGAAARRRGTAARVTWPGEELSGPSGTGPREPGLGMMCAGAERGGRAPGPAGGNGAQNERLGRRNGARDDVWR